ncbi:MAG: ubiquitin-like protein UBact [Candidatus Poribacteria bacterium]|nr:ubiquitin-like protein UBact [Candidatus Poribacteria bacterium]
MQREPRIELMQDRRQRPADPARRDDGDGDDSGPKRPDVEEPNRKRLLDRMKRVDRDQSKRYRQRTGQ